MFMFYLLFIYFFKHLSRILYGKMMIIVDPPSRLLNSKVFYFVSFLSIVSTNQTLSLI